jgi:hypothetical protein
MEKLEEMKLTRLAGRQILRFAVRAQKVGWKGDSQHHL